MTAANPNVIECPACHEPYGVTLETGRRFCPSCRHEWDPNAKPEPSPAEVVEDWAPTIEAAMRRFGETSEAHVTFVDVEHDDGGSGNWRTDRYTYITSEPHTALRAEIEATDHYMHEVGSAVRGARVVSANFAHPLSDAARVEMQTAHELEGFIAQTDAEANAYLDALVGTSVTLEGGQRATILEFLDGDMARLQLATGDIADVSFGDIVSHDNVADATEVETVEIDDDTAEMFGTASLTLACLVIEAGIAAIEGDGDQAHLVEPPTGWFPPDEDAIPLMELASASAVAMLIQTFALPRDALAVMVQKVRDDAIGLPTTTEDTGHDEHPDDDNTGDPDEPGFGA